MFPQQLHDFQRFCVKKYFKILEFSAFPNDIEKVNFCPQEIYDLLILQCSSLKLCFLYFEDG